MRRYSTKPIRILDDALRSVPRLGWSGALTETIREHGLSDQAASIFPRGPADLVLHHHKVQLNALAQHARAATGSSPDAKPNVTELVEARLLANAFPSPTLRDAQALLLRPSNVGAATASLQALADEIWYLAGDRSTDTTWYTRRGSLMALYVAAETMQARDHSAGFRDTLAFVRARVANWESVEYAEKATMEWLGFNAQAALNMASIYLK